MKKLVLASLCAMLFSINSSKAAELAVVGHGISKHLDNHNFNELPYGVGLRYQKGEYALQVGDYYNSLRKNSFYAGIDWSPIHTNISGCLNFESGLYAGGATGYKYSVTPMAGIQASFRCKNIFIRARAMPDIFYNAKSVGAVEIGFVVKQF